MPLISSLPALTLPPLSINGGFSPPSPVSAVLPAGVGSPFEFPSASVGISSSALIGSWGVSFFISAFVSDTVGCWGVGCSLDSRDSTAFTNSGLLPSALALW